MKKLRFLQVRLTADDLNKVKMNAQMIGYRYLSDYIRFVAVNHNTDLYLKIRDIHNKLLGETQKTSPKQAGIKKSVNTMNT